VSYLLYQLQRYAVGSYWIPGSYLVKFSVTGCFYRLYAGVVTDVAALKKAF
jgi:hypothetical protein